MNQFQHTNAVTRFDAVSASLIGCYRAVDAMALAKRLELISNDRRNGTYQGSLPALP